MLWSETHIKHTPKSQWFTTAKVSTLFTLNVYHMLIGGGGMGDPAPQNHPDGEDSVSTI